MPNCDPRDGGVGARALFLLESPGPKAVNSGYVSSDNPDPSARNFKKLLAQAGFARAEVALWNVVPHFISTKERNQNASRPGRSWPCRPTHKHLLGFSPICAFWFYAALRHNRSVVTFACLLACRCCGHSIRRMFSLQPPRQADGHGATFRRGVGIAARLMRSQTVIQRRTSFSSSSAVLPSSTMRPRSITAMRSASSTAKSKNCSTSTIAICPGRADRRSPGRCP